MDPQAAAALELSRRRAKQAAGAIRKAARLLAQADTGYDHFGSVHVDGPDGIGRAEELVRYAVEECGEIDVVLLRSTVHHGPPGGEGAGT